MMAFWTHPENPGSTSSQEPSLNDLFCQRGLWSLACLSQSQDLQGRTGTYAGATIGPPRGQVGLGRGVAWLLSATLLRSASVGPPARQCLVGTPVLTTGLALSAGILRGRREPVLVPGPCRPVLVMLDSCRHSQAVRAACLGHALDHHVSWPRGAVTIAHARWHPQLDACDPSPCRAVSPRLGPDKVWSGPLCAQTAFLQLLGLGAASCTMTEPSGCRQRLVICLLR